MEANKLPGVGKYDSEVLGILNSSPKVGFGTGPRQGISDPTKDYLPGPGTYKITMGSLNGPRLSMRPKLNYAPEEKEGKFKPGPASYNHEKLSVLPKDAAWSMGTERR